MGEWLQGLSCGLGTTRRSFRACQGSRLLTGLGLPALCGPLPARSTSSPPDWEVHAPVPDQLLTAPVWPRPYRTRDARLHSKPDALAVEPNFDNLGVNAESGCNAVTEGRPNALVGAPVREFRVELDGELIIKLSQTSSLPFIPRMPGPGCGAIGCPR